MVSRIMVLTALLGALAATSVPGEEINPIVGKVGDFVLRETDLDRLIGSQPAEIQKQFQVNPEQKVDLVKDLLTKKAVAQRAKKDGFDRKPDVREQLSYVTDEFLTREYLIKVVLVGISVPEDDLKKYYRDNEKNFIIPESIKVRHIFVQATKDATVEEKAKARSKAEGALQRLKKGEDFARLAQELSEDSDTSKKGGELGLISPGKTNSEEFEKAAFALKAGEISDVVLTPYGYHIIRVDERKERRTATFDETREYLLKTLQKEYEQKRAQEYLEKATKEAGMEVFADTIVGKKEEAK